MGWDLSFESFKMTHQSWAIKAITNFFFWITESESDVTIYLLCFLTADFLKRTISLKYERWQSARLEMFLLLSLQVKINGWYRIPRVSLDNRKSFSLQRIQSWNLFARYRITELNLNFLFHDRSWKIMSAIAVYRQTLPACSRSYDWCWVWCTNDNDWWKTDQIANLGWETS